MKKHLLILFGILLSIQSFGQVPTTNLAGEYKFTSGSLNDTGGSNNFTQTGSNLTNDSDRLSTSSNAVAINGDHLTGSNIPATDMTISFWLKTTTNDGNERTILDESERTSYYGSSNAFKQGWYTYLINGKVGFGGSYKHGESYPSTGSYLSAYTGFQQLVSTTVVSDGFWHNVVVTANQEIVWDLNTSTWIKRYTYQLYIDGVLENTLVVDRSTTAGYINVYAELVPAGSPLVVGNFSESSPYPLLTSQRYADTIDDIRIYTSVLSTNDILELANEDFCAKPTNMQVSDLSHTSATISWDANADVSNWDLVYVASGQPIANGTTISTPTTSVSISGLSSATAYDVFVRSNCSNGIGITGYTNVLTFTTSNTPIFVDSNASGANNGSSWANAFTSLQSALAVANSTKQVWVAAGTYIPHASDRKGTFNLLTGTKMYGGFNGTETATSQRNVKTNITVLSGDLLGNDNNTILDTEATRSDNSYHVITLRGAPQDVVVDGFTISGGNANGSTSVSCATAAASQYYDIRGGAIYVNTYVSGQSITAMFSNCILEKNTGTNVAVFSSFTPCGVTNMSFDVDFESCIIRNNYSKDLTNMLFSGASGYTIYARGSISNSLFYDNTAVSFGSCLYLGASTSGGGNTSGLNFDLINTTFSNNSGVNGNVITMINSGNSRIKNSIIYGNGSTTPFAITTSGSVVSNSIVEGGQQSGTNSDPLFFDAANDDYSLLCNSPAVDAGNSAVTLPATDLAGNARTVNTLDMGAYEFSESFTAITAIAKNITVQLDAAGNATITPAVVNNGSGAVCGVAYTLSLDKSTFDCTDLGANTVTLTATETVSGDFATATATVTIVDDLAPTAIAQNITVQLNGSGNASITAANVNNGSFDNCSSGASLILALDNTAYTCSDLGANTVTLTVTDGSGNQSTTTATVTVVDNIAPIVTTQNITVQLNAAGNATITTADINNGSSDNCTSVGNLVFGLNKTSFTCADLGVNVVMLTVTDASNNQSSAAANVTIEDNIVPTAITQNLTLALNSSGNATLLASNVNNGSSDNCTSGLIYSLDKTAFTCADLGANTVTLTVTDASANQSTATATITVVDNIAPNAIAQNITAQLDAAGNATITASNINNGSSDNCTSIGNLILGLSKATFTCADLGTNNVTLTVEDASGNQSTAIAVVTVEDNIAPTAISKNLTLQLDAFGNATLAASSVNNGSNDNCTTSGNLVLALNKTSFNCSDLGPNIVTLIVTDASGNQGTSTSTITIEDNIVPVSIAQNVTLQLDASGNATLAASSVNSGSSDNCSSGGSLTLGLSKSAFTCADLGANSVTLTVTDASGNQATTNATVTVIDAITPTVITQNLTLQLDASGNATLTAAAVNNGSSDNCTSSGNLILSLDKTSFSCTDLGVNIVTLTVTDESANQASTKATITVEDNISPTVITQNITVNLDDNGNASITSSDINNGSNDNCTTEGNLNYSIDITDFTTADLGLNTVTLTVTDGSGNSSSSSALVTVEEKANQTISFGTLSPKSYGDAAFSLSASASSGLAVSYSVISGPAILSGNMVSLNGVGNVIIEASQDGDNAFASAPTVQQSFIVNKADLTVTAQDISITFGETIPTLVFTYNGFVNGENATALNTEPTISTIASDNSNVGTYDIILSGGIADNYLFNFIDGELTINKADQVITIEAISDKNIDDTNFDVIASTTSGLALTYDASGPATISGTTISLSGTAGTVSVTVSQAGNTNYNAGTNTISFDVIDNSKQAQSITFAEIDDQVLEAGQMTLVASASSGLDVTLTIVSGPATISGNEISFNNIGTVVIRASQSGNDSFLPATDVEQSFEIFTITSSIQENEVVTIKIYPNPVVEQLTITGLSDNVESITLVDMNGIEIHKYTPNSKELTLNVHDLNLGMYMAIIKSVNSIQHIRFIKK